MAVKLYLRMYLHTLLADTEDKKPNLGVNNYSPYTDEISICMYAYKFSIFFKHQSNGH